MAFSVADLTSKNMQKKKTISKDQKNILEKYKISSAYEYTSKDTGSHKKENGEKNNESKISKSRNVAQKERDALVQNDNTELQNESVMSTVSKEETISTNAKQNNLSSDTLVEKNSKSTEEAILSENLEAVEASDNIEVTDRKDPEVSPDIVKEVSNVTVSEISVPETNISKMDIPQTNAPETNVSEINVPQANTSGDNYSEPDTSKANIVEVTAAVKKPEEVESIENSTTGSISDALKANINVETTTNMVSPTAKEDTSSTNDIAREQTSPITEVVSNTENLTNAIAPETEVKTDSIAPVSQTEVSKSEVKEENKLQTEVTTPMAATSSNDSEQVIINDFTVEEKAFLVEPTVAVVAEDYSVYTAEVSPIIQSTIQPVAPLHDELPETIVSKHNEVAEAVPTVETPNSTQATPIMQTESVAPITVAESTIAVESIPVVNVAPTFEAIPVVDVTSTVVATPVVNTVTAPTVEPAIPESIETAASIAETPVMKSTVEAESVVEAVPVAVAAPVVQPVQIVEPTPIVEPVPIIKAVQTAEALKTNTKLENDSVFSVQGLKVENLVPSVQGATNAEMSAIQLETNSSLSKIQSVQSESGNQLTSYTEADEEDAESIDREIAEFESKTGCVYGEADPDQFVYYHRKDIRLKLHTGEKRDHLLQSIKINGIHEPILVRKAKDNKFEIIAGHNRHSIASELGIKVPYLLLPNVSDDYADQICVDTNLLNRQHSEMLPSELSNILMVKRKMFTLERVADEFHIASTTMKSFLKLQDLIPELLYEWVDTKKIGMTVGYALACSEKEQQQQLLQYLKKNNIKSISVKQGKEITNRGKLPWDDDFLDKVFGNERIIDPESVKPQTKVSITYKELGKYLNTHDLQDAKKTIYDALNLKKKVNTLLSQNNVEYSNDLIVAALENYLSQN